MRQDNYKIYLNAFKDLPIVKVPKTLTKLDTQTVPWIFFSYNDNAQELINFLVKEGVPASDFPALHPSVFKSEKFPMENKLYKEGVSLPVHQDLSKMDLEFIINKVKKFYENQAVIQ